MEQFCEKYHQGGPDYAVNLGVHILTDDNAKLAYCFVPKVGCTHLKVAFFRAQGMNLAMGSHRVYYIHNSC